MTEESTETTGGPQGPTPAQPTVIHEGLPTQLPDIDPEETSEWLGSFDAMLESSGRERARYMMLRLLERAREKSVGVPALRSTDYINTIPSDREPWFPGDEDIERRIRAFIRWNAAVMVSSANRKGLEVGGHIATYQSSASLYEVGFNHFFRGKDHPGGGDQVFIQGHASPASTRVRSSRAGSTRSSSSASARRFSTASARASRPTRTRVSCPTSGSSRRSRWA